MTDKKKCEKNIVFFCEKCDYTCSILQRWQRHTDTQKHKILTAPIVKSFNCSCGKKYKHRQSLFNHKQQNKCNNECNIETNAVNEINTIQKEDNIVKNEKPELDTNELIIQLLKQNQELQKSLIEISKDKNNIINNNVSTHNSTHKTFNLNFFLNEQCKDALNISDFVDSIKIQLPDLETTGRMGYVEGVSKIINKNLKELDKCKRPIHCSDLKREVLYIKDNNEWAKDDVNKTILKKAIKQIANKNIQEIMTWKNKYIDCDDSDSTKNDLYLKIIFNSMSGSTIEEQTNNYEKITSNVIKTVVIDK